MRQLVLMLKIAEVVVGTLEPSFLSWLSETRTLKNHGHFLKCSVCGNVGSLFQDYRSLQRMVISHKGILDFSPRVVFVTLVMGDSSFSMISSNQNSSSSSNERHVLVLLVMFKKTGCCSVCHSLNAQAL